MPKKFTLQKFRLIIRKYKYRYDSEKYEILYITAITVD